MTATHALVDIGNVLLGFDFEPALKTLVPNQATNEAKARVDRLLTRKDDFETGRLAEDEFISWASDQLEFTGRADEFRSAWNSIFLPIDEMWKAIKELKNDGLTLILFSNTNSIHAASFRRRYEIFDHFDHAVFSHEVGSMKPDEHIYRHAIAEFGLDPATTLYLDDLSENIATGERLGFRCHRYNFEDHPAFLAWLEDNR